MSHESPTGHAFWELQSQERRKKKTQHHQHVCEGCHTIMCEISEFKYDTYICLMALPPSEPLNRLVQLKESRVRVSLLKSALFLQKVTCLSLELTRKMHLLAVMLQRKKRKYLISICSVPPLGFHVHFHDSALGQVGTVKDAQLPKTFVILCPCQTSSLL